MGGEDGGQKNSADLLAIHLPKWKWPKQEESTIDRMDILAMAVMLTENMVVHLLTTTLNNKSLTALTSIQRILDAIHGLFTKALI